MHMIKFYYTHAFYILLNLYKIHDAHIWLFNIFQR
jgi:hypothetical protein